MVDKSQFDSIFHIQRASLGPTTGTVDSDMLNQLQRQGGAEGKAELRLLWHVYGSASTPPRAHFTPRRNSTAMASLEEREGQIGAAAHSPGAKGCLHAKKGP